MSFPQNYRETCTLFTTDLWVNLRVIEVSGPTQQGIEARVNELCVEGRILLPLYNQQGDWTSYYFVALEDEDLYREIEFLKENFIFNNPTIPRDLSLAFFKEQFLRFGERIPDRVRTKIVQDLFEANKKGFELTLVSIKQKQNGKFRVSLFDKEGVIPKKIGSGGYGKIYRLYGYTLNPQFSQIKFKFHAQKVLNSPEALATELMGQNVLTVLTRLNGGKTPQGIQEAPHFQRGIFIMKEYVDGNFDDWHSSHKTTVSLREIAELLLNPIIGLVFASEYGAQFFDIKSSNLLKNGNKVVLSDFGGAFFIPDLSDDMALIEIIEKLDLFLVNLPRDKNFTPHTPTNTMHSDLEAYTDRLENLRVEYLAAKDEYQNDPQKAELLKSSIVEKSLELKRLGEAIQVFQMGIILLKQLINEGKDPNKFFSYKKVNKRSFVKKFQVDKFNAHINKGKAHKRLIETFGSNGVYYLEDLILLLLDSNSIDRPSPRALLEGYKTLLEYRNVQDSAFDSAP